MMMTTMRPHDIDAENADDASRVRMRVHKGGKFLFHCEMVSREELPPATRRFITRAEELHFLQDMDIVISKRLGILEVERMIACCRQHPPQGIITITDTKNADESDAFYDLAMYLTLRERAGVAALSSGLLVLFIPLEDMQNHMRCLVVNAKTTVGESGAQLTATTARPSAVPTKTRRSQTELNDEEMREWKRLQRPGPSQVPSLDAVVTEPFLEPPKAGPSKWTRLRREHAAFNSFHHRVLLEWTTKPSDIDSAAEIEKQMNTES